MKLWKKSLLMFGAIILLTIGAGFSYLYTISSSTIKTLGTTYTKVGTSDTTKTLKATKPLTILLMGVDTGGVGRGTSQSWDGNSDSQIVMTLNPKTNTTTMVSMERDTMTNIINSSGTIVGKSQKMNAAYNLGFATARSESEGLQNAVSFAMNTIGQQSGITLDNFVVVNFDGLINLVDAVGGIDVYNDPKNIVSYEKPALHPGAIYIQDTEKGYTSYIEPGEQHLNGEQALVYSRDRHHRANGDYGRIAAQREVIAAIMKKVLALDNITQYQKLLNEASNDFKTNIPITSSTLTSLLGYKDSFKKVISIQYEAYGSEVYGKNGQKISYQFMPTNVYFAIQNNLRKSIGESEESTLNTNLITYENYFGSSLSNYLMPSATVTENGKSSVYGVNIKGELETITSTNSGKYVSTNGTAISSSVTSTNP